MEDHFKNLSKLSRGEHSLEEVRENNMAKVTKKRKIRPFLASAEKGKTAVKVIYRDGGRNESINSSDKRYLLYTLGCFLEDYLSDKVMRKIERKYCPET